MKALGIEWKTCTPLWPQGNAHAESLMKPIGKLLKTAVIEGKNWKQELQKFLLQYRQTPHTTTKIAPCELLFNRRISGFLPELGKLKVVNTHKQAKENIEKKKQDNRKYYDKKGRVQESEIKEGDHVICLQKKQIKLTPRFRPEILTVILRKHNTVTAQGKDGHTITRNVSHFKKMEKEESDDEWERDAMGVEDGKGIEESLVRRSTRKRTPTTRFGYEH